MSSTQRVERATSKSGIPAPGSGDEPAEASSVDTGDANPESARAPEVATAPDPQAARDRAQRIIRLESAIGRAARQADGLPIPVAQVQGFLALLAAANSLPDETRGPLLDRLERLGADLVAPVSRRQADVTLLYARLHRLWSDAGAAAEPAGK